MNDLLLITKDDKTAVLLHTHYMRPFERKQGVDKHSELACVPLPLDIHLLAVKFVKIVEDKKSHDENKY